VLQERGYRIVSGRTDCHLFLVDLRAKGLTGREAETMLGAVGITINKNAVPNDPQKATVTSGIRIGSPAITTRGFSEIEAEQLANLVADVLDARGAPNVSKRVAKEVTDLCAKYPVYGQ
jgi:glycine hydroxymethyltransferase